MIGREFNWDAYEQWASSMESKNEPHEPECACVLCQKARYGEYEREYDHGGQA